MHRIDSERIKSFYEAHLPGASWKGTRLIAPCPLCKRRRLEKAGQVVVQLHADSFFRGYFRCTNGCTPGGYHFHFARLLGIEHRSVPGYDPDVETYALDLPHPGRHLGPELDKFAALVGREQLAYFARFGVSEKTLKQMRIGFNGRSLVFPYIQENGDAYAARCISPERPEDHFWHGNEAFFTSEAAVYNCADIERCEGGALFITVGELNLLILKELGYPAIAVPAGEALDLLAAERLSRNDPLFLLVENTPEARLAARTFAVRLGFKARILPWPAQCRRGDQLADLAADPAVDTKKAVQRMIMESRPFSPFATPEKERRRFQAFLEKEKGKDLLGLQTGFARMDRHMEGLRGINILGGPPKAGKSCFFMQISTEVARRKVPVIYYDFENGRHKIYLRTLVRLTRLSEKKIRSGRLSASETQTLQAAQSELEAMLAFFRVVNDRRVTPELMRRHIDFTRHETRRDDLLIVVDSLHKLPFKDLTERRTGIDSWLRQLEAIRDEYGACFLVISELSRGKGGGYGEKPDLSSFKESGDIAYSADNALILMPGWDPMAPAAEQQRTSTLWMAASRESSPGKVGEYVLEYPFWGFREL